MPEIDHGQDRTIAVPRGRSRQPGVVIVCESGGVYRAFNESGGFLASGGPCVLHDEHGGHTSADAISVYDDAMSSP